METVLNIARLLGEHYDANDDQDGQDSPGDNCRDCGEAFLECRCGGGG